MTIVKKVYLVHVYGDHLSHIEKIVESDPDLILLWCDVEYEALKIFKNFLDQLNDYIVRHNKTVVILYPGPSRVVTENIYLEKSFGYYLLNYFTLVNSTKDIDFDNIHLEASKLFTLYCNRGSYERARIVDIFARENMLDEGVVTFHGTHLNRPPNWEYHDGSRLTDEDDFAMGANEHYIPEKFPRSFYKGLVDVVCESRVDDGEFFTTEKTAKSIVAMKPFLALSSQGYHRYLRYEYGIVPYSEIFDYKFDRYPDINDRIEAIVENIQRIKSMDKNEIHSRIFDKLVHNKKQFIKYSSLREKMVPSSLEFMFNPPYELLGDTHAIASWLGMVRMNGWLQ